MELDTTLAKVIAWQRIAIQQSEIVMPVYDLLRACEVNIEGFFCDVFLQSVGGFLSSYVWFYWVHMYTITIIPGLIWCVCMASTEAVQRLE